MKKNSTKSEEKTLDLSYLGFTPNESKIYQCLLVLSKANLSEISERSGINRRNCYDVILRLLEKGFVNTIVRGQNHEYYPVSPDKLTENVETLYRQVRELSHELNSQYVLKPEREQVITLQGLEGFKTYMRDILRLKEPVYVLGAKGVWSAPGLYEFNQTFAHKCLKEKIKFHFIFDSDRRTAAADLLPLFKAEGRFLPKDYKMSAAFDIFGDNIVMINSLRQNVIDTKHSLTYITNKTVAESFRIWWKAVWDISLP